MRKAGVQDETSPAAWDAAALARPHERPDKSRRVQAMFDAIAPTYERVNALLSFGRDAAWRRRAVAAADVSASDVVLDVACGTGDMIRAFARGRPAPRRIIGVDFSCGMLACGEYADVRVPVHLLRADAQRLPLADGSVDVVSCAFGVRNFQDLGRGLLEFARVLRRGGRVVILEFAVPRRAILRWPYRLYTERVLPRVGRWLSGDRTGAYAYLPRSVATFEQTQELARRLRESRFDPVLARPMSFGAVVLYRGVRR